MPMIKVNKETKRYFSQLKRRYEKKHDFRLTWEEFMDLAVQDTIKHNW